MARVPQQEEDALAYALEDYSDMTTTLLSSSAEWSSETSKVARCRSAIVAQIIRIRHELDIPHKLVQARIHSKERNAKKARRRLTRIPTSSRRTKGGYDEVVENCQGPATEDPSKEPLREPRPVLVLRQIGDAEETFHLKYRIQCVDANTSAIELTPLSRGKLALANELLPQLFHVTPVGGALPDLVLALTTPWTFLAQSSIRISDGSESNIVSSTIPTDVKGRDRAKRTMCTLGPLLASVVSPSPSKGCRAVINLKLSSDSFFMNSVLATGIPRVAPVSKVRFVLELAGFEFKGLPGVSPMEPTKEVHQGREAATVTKRKRGRPPKSKTMHAFELCHEVPSRSPSPDSSIFFDMEGVLGDSLPTSTLPICSIGQTKDIPSTGEFAPDSVGSTSPHQAQCKTTFNQVLLLPNAAGMDASASSAWIRDSMVNKDESLPPPPNLGGRTASTFPSGRKTALASTATTPTRKFTDSTPSLDSMSSSTPFSTTASSFFPSFAEAFVPTTSAFPSDPHSLLPNQSHLSGPLDPLFVPQPYDTLDAISSSSGGFFFHPMLIHTGGWFPHGLLEGRSPTESLPHHQESDVLSGILDHPWNTPKSHPQQPYTWIDRQ